MAATKGQIRRERRKTKLEQAFNRRDGAGVLSF